MLDGYVATYNTSRPHQALDMATPSERFYRDQSVEAEGSPVELEVVKGEISGLAIPPAVPVETVVPPTGRVEQVSRTAPPVSSGVFDVTRKVDSSGTVGFACAIYSAGLWLAGKTVTVRSVNDIVEIFHEGQLIRAYPRKHPKQKEDNLYRHRSRPGSDNRKFG